MKKRFFFVAAMLMTATAAMAESEHWTYYDCWDHGFQQMDVKTRTVPTCADFNNDGRLEVVYGGQNNGDWLWDWYERDGEWKWDWGWKYEWGNAAKVYGNFSLENGPQKLAEAMNDDVTSPFGIPTATHNFYRWIDFNNDGNLDMLVFGIQDWNGRGISEGDSHYGFLYENGGAETGYQFSKVEKFPFNVENGRSNFNCNDGRFDTSDERNMMYGAHNRGLTFGDINNDGYVDVVSQNVMGLNVYLGTGDGSFELKTHYTDNYREGDVKLADLDHDGNLDLVATGWSDMGYINFFKGNGDGTFEQKNPGDKRDIRSSGMTIGDFNGDGNLDVFFMGYSDQYGWISDLYLGHGDFTWERRENPVGDYIEGCVFYAIDVNNDGKLDLLCNHWDTMKWFKGMGDGRFDSMGYCTNRGTNNSGGGFTFGDIYGTGSLDMVIQSKHGDNVYMGTVRGVDNTIPTAPKAVEAQRSSDKKTFTVTWKAGSDKETPAKALAYNVVIKYGDTERALVPANLENGKLKVVQDMQTLITGSGEDFCATFCVPEDVASEDITVGVQTVDGVYAGSSFACTTVNPTFSETYNGQWNGKVNVPTTAGTIDDLLTYTVEFEEAASVAQSGFGVLAVLFDETSNPYAVVVDAVAGSVNFDHSKVTLHFQKISDLNAQLQALANTGIKKVAPAAQHGAATVVIAGKSFKIDGTYLYTDLLKQEYLVGTVKPTGINAAAIEKNGTMFNVAGQAVRGERNGIMIIDGKKIVK